MLPGWPFRPEFGKGDREVEKRIRADASGKFQMRLLARLAIRNVGNKNVFDNGNLVMGKRPASFPGVGDLNAKDSGFHNKNVDSLRSHSAHSR